MTEPDRTPDPIDDDRADLELRPPAEIRRWIMRQDAHARELDSIRALLAPLYDPWYTSCIECGERLGQDGDLYYVERALRRDEPLFEYALCETCVYAFQDDLSALSIQKIYDYWVSNYDFDRRQELLENSDDARDLVARCAFSDRPREQLEEFQVWAWIRDGKLWVDDYAPAILSASVIEEICGSLSRQTRDRIDDFIRDRLGMPPELQNLPLLL